MDNKILHNLELLGLIAGENSAGIERCLGIKQIDFKHFKDFVDIHQLSGNLYVSLGHSSLKGLFPPS